MAVAEASEGRLEVAVPLGCSRCNHVYAFRDEACTREDVLEGDIGRPEDLVREDLQGDRALAELGCGNVDPGHYADEIARLHQSTHAVADIARLPSDPRQGQEVELGPEFSNLSYSNHYVLECKTYWLFCNNFLDYELKKV